MLECRHESAQSTARNQQLKSEKKQEKLKSKKRICLEVGLTVKVWRVCSSPEEEKERLQWEGFAAKAQPCIPPGSLNRVPASAGVKAGMSPLPGGR